MFDSVYREVFPALTYADPGLFGGATGAGVESGAGRGRSDGGVASVIARTATETEARLAPTLGDDASSSATWTGEIGRGGDVGEHGEARGGGRSIGGEQSRVDEVRRRRQRRRESQAADVARVLTSKEGFR